MIALPKATSQGSKVTAGGASTAFTGISAATAEPDTIASATANQTDFFMTIPNHTLGNQSDSGVSEGQARTDCSDIPQPHSNVKRGCPPGEAKKISIC